MIFIEHLFQKFKFEHIVRFGKFYFIFPMYLAAKWLFFFLFRFPPQAWINLNTLLFDIWHKLHSSTGIIGDILCFFFKCLEQSLYLGDVISVVQGQTHLNIFVNDFKMFCPSIIILKSQVTSNGSSTLDDGDCWFISD